MARVQARANQRMMILDRLHDNFGRVPAVQLAAAGRAMGMNGDRDLVFIDELVQAVETIRARVRTEGLDAERLAEIENLFVGVVVAVETLDAKGDGLDVIVSAQREDRLDLLRTAGERSMLLEEFNEVQP